MGSEVLVLPKIYDLIVWFSPKITSFPKKYKYTLGDRLTNSMLSILEGIISARYSKKKEHFLRQCNLEIEKLRFLMRLAKDLQCLEINSYEFAITKLEEIGKMIGGWEKYSKSITDE